jgi:S1-C subfamily serine protease
MQKRNPRYAISGNPWNPAPLRVPVFWRILWSNSRGVPMSLLRTCCHIAAAVILLVASVACAQAATPLPSQQAVMEAMSRAAQAVVGVQVHATEDARSVESLGRERAGSGVVIGDDGLVLTIGYLILEADTIQLVTHDGRVIPARAVGYDLATGFGLVRSLLPLRGVRPAPFGTAADTALRTPLVAATGGEGGGLGVTQLVAARPFSGYWEYHIPQALFTSPPLRNHSGAPLFNARGELLGIGSLFVGDATGEGRGVPGNMFVPVDLLKPILAELEQTGTTRNSRRPWLGLSSSEQGGRVQIIRVSRESPAQQAGLAAGDVVLAIDGEKVATLEAFYRKLWSRDDPEGEVALTVLTGAEVRQLKVKPVDRMKTMRRPSGI